MGNHAAINALAESPTVSLVEIAIERFNACIASTRDERESELGLGEVALTKLLARYGAKIQSLSLAGWPLREKMGSVIGKYCPNLQVLNIADPAELCESCIFTPAGLSAIAECCPRLKAMS